ncbi:hypothetical protein PRZ48_011767 [Zasmidium cellare]|uniref:Uncharacterized protein n=1 Tax=Zasmidium cellare TaxID=395010 RepID=A0ABR0E7B6_ZASCE|nr:hypothetical protein PRZ48_011767 [Zasmidium cellare]
MAPELTMESQTDECDDTLILKKAPDEVEAKPFRLLDLPPELWIKIGQMTIDALAPIENKDIITWSRSWHTGKKPNQKPTLALTCHQLHAELMPYFYNTKMKLTWELNSYFEVHLGKWLNCIGAENRKHVKGMRALVWRSKGDSVKKKQRELGEFWKLKVDMTPTWSRCEEKTGRWTAILKVTMVE